MYGANVNIVCYDNINPMSLREYCKRLSDVTILIGGVNLKEIPFLNDGKCSTYYSAQYP